MWKLPILPIAVLIELCLLVGCALLALFSPDRAYCLSVWTTSTLPSLPWYLGKPD